jgi:hypothetical protein
MRRRAWKVKSLASVVRRQLPWLETSDHATLRAWCEHEIIGSAVFMKLMDDRVGWYLMAPFHFPQTGEIITPVAPEHLSQWTTVKTFPKGEKGCDGYKKVALKSPLRWPSDYTEWVASDDPRLKEK